jgi:hypothetical protein
MESGAGFVIGTDLSGKLGFLAFYRVCVYVCLDLQPSIMPIPTSLERQASPFLLEPEPKSLHNWTFFTFG